MIADADMRDLYVDGQLFRVPVRVWAHCRFLTERNAAMADHVVRLSKRVQELEAGQAGRAA